MYSNTELDLKIKEYKKKGVEVPDKSILKTKEQIEGIRESGKINIAILDKVSENIKVGMTTDEIDKIVYNTTLEMGGHPAPLGFEGFPKSVCTSINNQVCHGIPSEEDVLFDGDIINVDVSTLYNGYYSDSSRMFMIGNVLKENKKLVEVAKECVYKSLEAVKPFGFLGDIADIIQKTAKKNGYSVVKEIGGHGIGLEFHEEPFVSYVLKKGKGMLLVPGMVFTIEPMINMGGSQVFIDESNDWTIYTYDDSFSAQWEITVVVTDSGYEILVY